jgi:hypothetical protein
MVPFHFTHPELHRLVSQHGCVTGLINCHGRLPTVRTLYNITYVMSALASRWRLDELFKPKTHVTLMKLEVEGYECRVLEGAMSLFRSTNVVRTAADSQLLEAQVLLTTPSLPASVCVYG